MRFPHFFIDRPIFAAVLSILIVIMGAVVTLIVLAILLPILQLQTLIGG